MGGLSLPLTLETLRAWLRRSGHAGEASLERSLMLLGFGLGSGWTAGGAPHYVKVAWRFFSLRLGA